MGVTQQRAAAVGVDAIMQAWDLNNLDLPYFAVFFNSRGEKYFQYNGEDLDKARQFLMDNLIMISDQGDNSLYYLKIYPAYELNFKRNTEIACIPIRCNAFGESSQQVNGPQYTSYQSSTASNGHNGNIYDLLIKRFEEYDKKLLEAQTAVKEPDTLDRIAGYMENEHVSNAVVNIIGAVMPVIAKIIPDIGSKIAVLMNTITPKQPPMQTGLAGVNEVAAPSSTITPQLTQDELDNVLNERIDAALDRLEKHCNLGDDLTALADMAENNPAMFQFLLNNLRSQK